jgi:hypothetical protein
MREFQALRRCTMERQEDGSVVLSKYEIAMVPAVASLGDALNQLQLLASRAELEGGDIGPGLLRLTTTFGLHRKVVAAVQGELVRRGVAPGAIGFLDTDYPKEVSDG